MIPLHFTVILWPVFVLGCSLGFQSQISKKTKFNLKQKCIPKIPVKSQQSTSYRVVKKCAAREFVIYHRFREWSCPNIEEIRHTQATCFAHLSVLNDCWFLLTRSNLFRTFLILLFIVLQDHQNESSSDEIRTRFGIFTIIKPLELLLRFNKRPKICSQFFLSAWLDEKNNNKL